MTESLPLATVEDRLTELVDLVNREHERVVVTRNGVPAVVLVSVEELGGLKETLEILSDPEAMAAIRESEEQVAQGLALTISEADARARWVKN